MWHGSSESPSFFEVAPMKSLAILLLALAAIGADTAFAQPSADAKARGRFNFYGRNARSAMRAAKESAGSLREYVYSTQPEPARIAREQPGVSKEVAASEQTGVVVVSPRIVQSAADEIGDSITKSERHLAWMRRQAEAMKDNESLAALDAISMDLAVAKRNHDVLCGCCFEDSVDSAAAVACCQTIDEALAKAISEHDALMNRLGGKSPGTK